MRNSRLPRVFDHPPAGILWLLWALFVVYGSTAPFRFVGSRTEVATKLTDVVTHQFHRMPIDDAVANSLLFAPFGFLGAAAIGRRYTRASPWIATGLAALFSVGVETLQLFTVDRLPAIDDVMANTLGALAGAFVARRLLDRPCGWVDRARTIVANVPAMYPTIVAGAVICVAAWEPFDFTGDVIGVSSVFAHKVRAIGYDPWQVSVPIDEPLQLVRYAQFTLLVAVCLAQSGVRMAAGIAALVGSVAGVLLEGSRFVVDSRMPGLAGAAANVTGALAGAWLARVVPRRSSPILWCALLVAATAVGAALHTLSPYTLWGASRGYTWYRSHAVEIFSHLLEVALTYFPIGFAVPLAIQRRRSIQLSAAVVTALLISGAIEALHRWVGGSPQIADLVVAVLGSALGAWASGPGWKRFQSFVSPSDTITES